MEITSVKKSYHWRAGALSDVKLPRSMFFGTPLLKSKKETANMKTPIRLSVGMLVAAVLLLNGCAAINRMSEPPLARLDVRSIKVVVAETQFTERYLVWTGDEPAAGGGLGSLISGVALLASRAGANQTQATLNEKFATDGKPGLHRLFFDTFVSALKERGYQVELVTYSKTKPPMATDAGVLVLDDARVLVGYRAAGTMSSYYPRTSLFYRPIGVAKLAKTLYSRGDGQASFFSAAALLENTDATYDGLKDAVLANARSAAEDFPKRSGSADGATTETVKK